MNLYTLVLLIHTLSLTAAFSPSGGYGPGNVTCPKKSTAGDSGLVRHSRGLCEDESNWLKKRHEHTDEALKEFLETADLEDFDVEEFFDKNNQSINIGLAFSGGGYRAMLCGAGQISALDDRTDGANETGLGGLLQSATYLTGLSGGNWMTGTLALNNWTSVQEIIEGDSIWNLEHSIFTSGGINIFKTVGQWDDISDSIQEKKDAGFNTSITDIWGRALSYQFFGKHDNGGDGLTFSTLRDVEVFQNGEMPLPISVATGRTPTSKIINLNSTVFEFTPFELGSWDPSLYAFTDLKYVGSNVDNGDPESDTCIAGFDNAGFVMGTSSSLFNQFLLKLNTTGITGVVHDLIEDFLHNLSEDFDDIAIYGPNPFYNTPYATVKTIVDDENLYLCDGGEDNQNVPLAPLLQPERDVDVIFAFDNSADTDDSFPDGASLVATYERQFASQGNGTAFPYVPGQSTFLAHNLTTKPTFFGCDASNLTDLAYIPPLVVYIANEPFTFWSNTSTFKMEYEDDEKLGMIKNGYEVSSRYNMTIDEDWKKCVSCAIIRRSQERRNETQSDECEKCFEDYCWDGKLVTEDVDLRSQNYTSSNGAEDASSEGEVSTSSNARDGTSESSGSSSSDDSKKSSASQMISYKSVSNLLYSALFVSAIALFA
ncbi:lysophospholipase [Wickerhamomyces ciferrii]|uniref:Lysophospholipase n=1 Tax=Wickerhamomyces ciferrii (strain ATCC 14091 / BCRC 22168 / CBS 111 / JCM 3599 / NBRC 0793 / NRRL Y-1031 F-60-10) TaxID=1206466 RepID=K0K8C8_WICCF|nr:lysophospholipase [Wickerhamomyces ciferrii]CCH41095.1 lysophospholipase [Wickerhamomyces ciferrii]